MNFKAFKALNAEKALALFAAVALVLALVPAQTAFAGGAVANMEVTGIDEECAEVGDSITVNATVSATTPPGQLSQYGYVIYWGDGDVYDSGTGFFSDNDPVNISQSHSYGSASPSNPITVAVYHQNPNGQDGSDEASEEISICITDPETGSITILKDTDDVSGDSVEFDFTGDLGSFSVLGDNSDSESFSELSADTYSITESAESGWSFDSVTCDAGDYTAENPLSINLAEGEDVTCTFSNTMDQVQPATGTLIVYKNVVSGSAPASDFTINVLDDQAQEVESDPGNASGTEYVLEVGDYTITEDEDPNYTASFASCGDGTVSVTEGQTTECTVENSEVVEELGSISGTKHDWSTEDGLSGWVIFLDENENGVHDEGEATITTDGDGNYSFVNLQDGDYDVCEVQQTGWEQQTPDPENGNNGCHAVTITEGSDSADNDFWNREIPSETIEMCKLDENEAPVIGWGMTLTNDTEGGTFELETDDNGCVTQEVNPENGPWIVIEEEREGWTFVDADAENGTVEEGQGALVCEFFGDSGEPLQQLQLQVVVQDPEYRCTFVNERPDDAPVCEVGDNLLTNGSFEDPAIGSDWSYSSIANWVITAVTGGASTTGEIWRNFMGGPSEGDQHVELDAEDESTMLAQDVSTIPGATYQLRFDFSPRPDTDGDNNSVDALVDGNVLMNAQGDGSALSETDWTTHSDTFVANGATTEIALRDAAANLDDGVGSLVDNAVLCLVREPEDDDDDDSSTGGGGGGGGERIELTERDDEPEDEGPEPEVLGEQVSAVPAGAPNTGAGGAAGTALPSAVALLGMLLSVAGIRATRNG